MPDFKPTLDGLMALAQKKNLKTSMDDNGIVYITFDSQAEGDNWLRSTGEFHFTGTNHFVAANIEGDFCIIATGAGNGGKTIQLLVHGLHDWIPLMEKIARWRELPDETTLGEVTKMMQAYMKNSDIVRKGLYTLIGSTARRVGNPDHDG